MDGRFENLFLVLRQLQAGSAELKDSLPLPPPWETWTLLALVRHRKRQEWVATILRTNLGADPTLLAAQGALGHPNHIPQHGLVPGLTEWEYFFHGRGCRLTRRRDGIEIDVDFVDDTADFIDAFFFQNYLESLKNPEPVEKRVLELHPSLDSLSVTIEALKRAGVMGRNPTKLSPSVVGEEAFVESFISSWDGSADRTALSAAIGDSPGAGLSGARLRQLEQAFEDGRHPADALYGLASLHSPRLHEYLERALSGPPSSTSYAALSIIENADDPRWCSRIFTTLQEQRATAGSSSQWIQCVKFMLKHGYRTADVLAVLADPPSTDGESGLIALEHAPRLAIPLFRKSLRSRVPLHRVDAAAILALIGQPWSTRELLQLLEETDDHAATAEARSALRQCHDRRSEQAAEEWDGRNPKTPVESKDGWIPLSEVRLVEGDFVTLRMQKFHDRALRVRDRDPQGPA